IRKLPCFDVEIPDHYKHKWSRLYIQYRKDMSTALNGKRPNSNEEANEVIKLYKQIFNGAINIADGSKSITDIYNEALAVYHVIYDYAIAKKDVARCGFAWKVAGSVLVRKAFKSMDINEPSPTDVALDMVISTQGPGH
ncbi:putative RNA-dependent RNA polymerase 5-like, partial [Trifolium medium]|nr:putative RNA-dependent RNA polymerase 5-like [Trifolium medium]